MKTQIITLYKFEDLNLFEQVMAVFDCYIELGGQYYYDIMNIKESNSEDYIYTHRFIFSKMEHWIESFKNFYFFKYYYNDVGDYQIKIYFDDGVQLE